MPATSKIVHKLFVFVFFEFSFKMSIFLKKPVYFINYQVKVMSVQRLENTVKAAQVGAFIKKIQDAKSDLNTRVKEAIKVLLSPETAKDLSTFNFALQRERSFHYTPCQKVANAYRYVEKLCWAANDVLAGRDLCTRLRATDVRLLRLVNKIECYCKNNYWSEADGVQVEILDVVENIKVNLPKKSEEVRSNIEHLLEAIKPGINRRIDTCISGLEPIHSALLKEEREQPSLHELRVFIRDPRFLAVQKVNQEVHCIFTDHFFYSKNLIEILVSRFCKDPKFAHVDKSTLFTREKLLTGMIIKTLFGNQDRHRILANRPREASLVPAVKGWVKEFNFVATSQFSLQSIQACKQRVEKFDLSLIADEEDLILKAMTGDELGLTEEVKTFIADVKRLVGVHAFNHKKTFSQLITNHQSSAYYPFLGDYEDFIMTTVVNKFLKDLESPVKQKIEECKVLLNQETSEANSDAILKILVDLYKAGYGLELKNSIFPLFSQEKHYPCISSFIEVFVRCDSYYEAYEFCLQLPNQEQKEIFIAQCLQKLKERSETILKERYCWINHDFLLRNIVDFYINGKEQKIEGSISCLFSHAFSSEALRAIKVFFIKAGKVQCYERFCSKFPGVLVPWQEAN